ncbi:MAG TPA: DMT family transporter, partial [Rhodocyclaceae bacterium]|nr:DMT family transporter [Rhodocyclaceae bacterium]
MSDLATAKACIYGGDPSHADLPLMFLTPALFAANMVAARLAEGIAIPPLFLAFGRWSLAFLVILPLAAPRIWAWREVLISHWRRLFLLAGLGMGVTVAPQYIGARETSAANIALIFAACPALVVLLETAIWRTTLGWKRLGG